MTHYEMRRGDRALTEEETYAVLDDSAFITIGTTDADGAPYAVPVSFVRRDNALYIHSTNEGGHKLDNFNRDARVCATAVTDVQAYFAKGHFSTEFRSAMAFGHIREVTDTNELRHAHVDLCMKYVPEAKHEIGQAMEQAFAQMSMWAIDIEEVSGKAHLKSPDET